jgi:hypothetical protein
LSSRPESNELINQAKRYDIETLLAKDNNGYIVYLYGGIDEIRTLFSKYQPPNIIEDHEEDYTDDLSYLLNQVYNSNNKLLSVKILFSELKRLVKRKRIIKLQTDERTIHVRRVGNLIVENDDYVIQSCGDKNGMAVWTHTKLKDVKKVSA